MPSRFDYARRLRRPWPWSRSVRPAGVSVPPPPIPIPGDKIIWIPMGKVAIVNVVGRDINEVVQPIEGQIFVSQDLGVFTVVYARGSGTATVTPVAVGSAGLALAADALIGPPVILLEDVLTINVYSVAATLHVFSTIIGSPNEQAVAQGGVILLPLNHTAIIRMEGRDAGGRTVPLQSQVFSAPGAGIFHLTPASPPVAGTAIIVPDSTGVDTLEASADGDPSPSASPLTWFGYVGVEDPAATHLTGTYALTTPPPNDPPPASNN